MPSSLQLKYSIEGPRLTLRWKPVVRAKRYVVQWLDQDREWIGLAYLEGEETVPDAEGFVQYVDETPGSMGPGGTYRIAAYFTDVLTGAVVLSPPIVAEPYKPKRTSRLELQRRLKRIKGSADAKAHVLALKWSRHGWTTVLPAEAGTCLGKRIELHVRQPDLGDDVLGLLLTILVNLPKLAARAEKAWQDYDGDLAVEDERELKRPRVLIDPAMGGKATAGRWSILIGLKSSDYTWHVNFARQRFREIWAGS